MAWSISGVSYYDRWINNTPARPRCARDPLDATCIFDSAAVCLVLRQLPPPIIITIRRGKHIVIGLMEGTTRGIMKWSQRENTHYLLSNHNTYKALVTFSDSQPVFLLIVAKRLALSTRLLYTLAWTDPEALRLSVLSLGINYSTFCLIPSPSARLGANRTPGSCLIGVVKCMKRSRLFKLRVTERAVCHTPR